MADQAPRSPSRSKYAGRAGRVGRSARQNSHWDGEIEAIYSTSLGEMTRNEYFYRKQRADPDQRFDMVLGKMSDSVYSRRSCVCGGEIRYLPDGKAVCENPHCSTVFNDGGNTNGMVQVTKIFKDGHKEAIPPKEYGPRKNKFGYKNIGKFLNACKA